MRQLHQTLYVSLFRHAEHYNKSQIRMNLLTGGSDIGCYPFQEKDPFVIEECPHVFFVGNQPKFDSTVIMGYEGHEVRLIAVPKFKETGEVVLLDTDTLEVEVVGFQLFGDD